MITVVANLAWLRPGRVGGSEEYTLRLLEAVRRLAPDDVTVRVVGSAALAAATPLVTDILPGPLAIRPFRLVVESTVLAARTRDADVVHHFGGRLPARRHGRDVVTIHDLQPLDLPDNFSPVKRRYLAHALPRTVGAAAMITTPSQWVADGIVDRFGVGPEKVRAVSSTWDPDGDAEAATAGRPPDTGPPTVLFPAMTHPHKNHRVLVEAVERLAERHPDVVLVLTGGPGRAEAEVAALVERARVRIERPGRVPAAELRRLLGRATVLAFPSRYEGFGLPVLEAMHAGVPVVAARAGALPEVVGDAGDLVDPDDVDGWAVALDRVLADPAVRAAMVERGRARAAAYRPEVAAGRLLDVWRAVAAR